MMHPRRATAVLLSIWCALSLGGAFAAESPAGPASEIVTIWPGQPPGTADWSGEEGAADVHVPDAGRVVHIIRNVTQPTLTVVRPAPGRGTGAGMIVLPGGAFGALAWDLEGMEVARWLADRGVTAFVLKYRVHDADPAMTSRINEIFSAPAGSRFDDLMKVLEPRWRIAVDDARQAIRLIRSRAVELGISADRIGMMGFSAGAITTMGVVVESDSAARPNIAAPIYGAMALAQAPPKEAPPLFIAAAADDPTVPATKSTAIFDAWQSAGISAELHIYRTGGHGFGLGKPGTASTAWTNAFETWLVDQGFVTGSNPQQTQSL